MPGFAAKEAAVLQTKTQPGATKGKILPLTKGVMDETEPTARRLRQRYSKTKPRLSPSGSSFR